MDDVRDRIIGTFADWTALSALRSGAPVKSRRDIYSALGAVDFAVLFDADLGPIDEKTFNTWHEDAVQTMIDTEPRLTVGWATKLINVYLKTRVYVAGQGRPGLVQHIHPPIDAGLWVGLQRAFPNRRDILDKTNCVSRIKDIVDYGCYSRIINGCRDATMVLGCDLIELEQLWTGTEYV